MAKGPDGKDGSTGKLKSDNENAPAQLECVVTYLEMHEPPRHPNILSGRHKIALMRAESPTVSFYRYLYDTIGEDW